MLDVRASGLTLAIYGPADRASYTDEAHGSPGDSRDDPGSPWTQGYFYVRNEKIEGVSQAMKAKWNFSVQGCSGKPLKVAPHLFIYLFGQNFPNFRQLL